MIFVFGSNEAGRHGAGAALAARQQYGAIYGQGYGMQGNSFAIPTKDRSLKTLPLDKINSYVQKFFNYARARQADTFNVTRIGCGLAGYKDEQIAPMFKDAPPNCKLPNEWKEFLKMSKPILCLDFDGVLHSYTSGWQGADIIPDPPVPGAMKFLADAIKHFTVHIYSSRSGQPGGIAAMENWLQEHLTCENLETNNLAAPRHVMVSLNFPNCKPSAMVTIDDRAITFTGEWPKIETLLAFKPWNKK